jgi:hypothetical protein
MTRDGVIGSSGTAGSLRRSGSASNREHRQTGRLAEVVRKRAPWALARDEPQAPRLAIGVTLAPPPVPEAWTSSSVMTAVRPGRASVLQLIAEEVAPQLLEG